MSALHHLAFRTHQLEALVSFYTELFGFPIARDERPRAVWCDLGGAVLMIERADEGEVVTGRARDVVIFAGEPAEFRDRLRAREVREDGATDFTVYVRDPDGRRVGVSRYPLSSQQSDDLSNYLSKA